MILVRLPSRKKAGPRPPLSPGHAVHPLVDVIPMLLAFKGNWFQSLFLSSWGKWKKAGIFGGIVSIDCWNMLKWYWKCPSIWLLWIDSLFQWDKSETRKNKYISKFVWAMATFGDLTPKHSWGMEGVQRLGETGAKNARKKPYFKGKSCRTFYKKTAVGKRNTTNIQLITILFSWFEPMKSYYMG